MPLPTPLRLLCLLTGSLALLLSSGCRRQDDTVLRKSGFKDFIPLYNRYINGWLKEQQEATEQQIAKLSAKIEDAEKTAADSSDSTKIEEWQIEMNALLRDREKWQYRLSLGDYFNFSDPSTIPEGLDWQDGMDEPEIGDPRAKKGGAFRRFIATFPPTIRPTGPNSNNSFRGDLYDYIDLTLVSLHPETLGMIPGLAKQWAVSDDGRTTYFRINPKATYSDGSPVKATDFLFKIYVYISDHIVNPYYKQFYREEIAQLTVHDDHTLSVSLPEAMLYAPAIAGSLSPAHQEFYAEYGPDYSERYQWRFPPTTGAYKVAPEDVIKGVSITQTRVKDWWAKDLKYYRYRFNPDKVANIVVRDESKAFELFRAGELDTFLLGRPDLWYEKSEMDPVYKGYIERVTFYTRYPKIPRGFYINVTKEPVNNRDVRVGIDHSMNWQKVIDVMFRGDAQRLNAFNEGYGKFSDPNIQARSYSIPAARDAFARAGYTEEDDDGILAKPDGTRLSVAVTYPSFPIYDRIFAILREDALACGLDFRLEGLESTVSYKKVMQKQHQMTFTGWVIQPPTPVYHQYLHSSNAFDDKGNPKPQTNNIFSWARPDTDRLSVAVRTARTEEELAEAALKLQNIMHDEAIFLPAYTVDYDRIGYWRWVRWPDCENTRFCAPVVYDPHEVFVFWIDDDMKHETQAARRSGRAFPEVARTIDDYRITGPQPESEPEIPQLEIPQPEIPQPEIPESP